MRRRVRGLVPGPHSGTETATASPAAGDLPTDQPQLTLWQRNSPLKQPSSLRSRLEWMSSRRVRRRWSSCALRCLPLCSRRRWPLAPSNHGPGERWRWQHFSCFSSGRFRACAQGRLKILWSPLYVPAGFLFLLGMIQFAGHLTMDSMATREALVKLSTDLILFFLAGQIFSAPTSERERLKTSWHRFGSVRQRHRAPTFCPLPPSVGLSSCTRFSSPYSPSSSSFPARA
jgi:hypothetical protein